MAAEAVHRHLLSQVELIRSPDDIIQRVSALKLLLTSQLDDKGSYQLIENGLIDPSSPLGHFIRRVVVESESLSFEGVCRLLRQIQSYHHAYKTALGRGLFRAFLVPEPTPPPPQLQHFEKLQLEHNLWELDRMLGQGANAVAGSTVLGQSSSAAAPPTEVQARDAVRAALDVDVSNPRAHLLSHHLALADRDVTTALESVRRYFDCTAAPRPLTEHPGGIKTKEFFALIGAVSPSCRVASQGARAQNAMMALAVTQAYFGHGDEALQALHEAMRAAQQSNDDLLLTQALALLTQLLERRRAGGAMTSGGDAGAGAETGADERVDRMLVRCAQRAAELRLPHLLAFSTLALARLSTATGTGYGPRGPSDASAAHCVEAAARALSTIRCVTDTAAAAAPMVSPAASQAEGLAPAAPEREVIHWGSGAAGPILGPAVAVFQDAAPVASSTAECEASMLLVRAGQLSLLAAGPLAIAPLRAQLLVHARTASVTDRAAAFALLTALEGEYRGPEAAREVLRRAQNDLAADDDAHGHGYGRTSTSGREKRRGGGPYLGYARALLEQAQATRRGDADASEQACRELLAATSQDLMPREWRVDAELRYAAHLRTFGRAAEAADRLSEAVLERLGAGDRATALRALLDTALCHLALESPSTALPYALSAVAQARDLGLDGLHAEASVTLADALTQMGPEHAPYALKMIQAVRPRILGQAPLALQARCQRVLAEVLIAQCADSGALAGAAPRILLLLKDAAKISQGLGDVRAAGEAETLRGLVQAAGSAGTASGTA